MAKKKEVKLSVTRMNTFNQCKLKYKFNYIDHFPRLSNPAFKLGTSCHEALEYAGNIWIEKSKKAKDKKKVKFTDNEKEKILKEYTKFAAKEGMDDIQALTLGEGLVYKRISNFTDGEILIELEKKFGFGGEDAITTEQGVPLIGAIDRVSKYDDDTLVISDYKTSATAPTAQEVRYDMQLSLYDLVANQVYPGYKRIILCLDMLKFEPIYSYRNEEDRRVFADYIKAVYDIMVSFDPEKDAKPTLNTFCPWCDYKTTCPAYESVCKKTDYKFYSLPSMSDEELYKEWEHIKSSQKIIGDREKEVKAVVINKIKTNESSIINEDKELYIRQNSKTQFDVKTVYEVVPREDFLGLISLSKSSVDKYIAKANPSIQKAIIDSKTVNFNAPFLNTRKLIKDKKNKL